MITTTETPAISVEGMLGSTFSIAFVSIDAKAVDAEADDKKPASVTPICIVDKKRVELLVSFNTIFAFLWPSSAIFSIFASLREIIAISLIAKNAFIRIRAKSKRIFKTIENAEVSVELLNGKFDWLIDMSADNSDFVELLLLASRAKCKISWRYIGDFVADITLKEVKNRKEFVEQLPELFKMLTNN